MLAIIWNILKNLTAIPTLINIITLIIGLINRLPKPERKVAFTRLKDICLRAKQAKTMGMGLDSPAKELEAFLAELRIRV